VDFSDRFIRPNYQAQLSDLTGRLGGFSSDGALARTDGASAPQMADLELRGKAEGTASLEVVGKLNPLATPLALDIEGRVRDLELPPLSPYAIKYTGHGIERGKLSLDVAYTVLPNGQLTARNQLVLNQLTFGDAVAGAPASLPVRLAVALLADRQGVIDLNLPIAGSLNDPEFSLLPIVFKAIGNVIVKAITSPFALLSGALGGDDADNGSVAFVPGTARLAPGSDDKLARLAQALADKPRLTLTVVGAASLDAERSAYQRERLLAQLREERARQTPGADTGGELDAAEHTRWLTALYKRTDMPKPRNALGLAKDIAPEDMEALLLAQIPATDAHMQALATQRGAAVRDHLVRLKVPAQRLFLGAPTTQTPEGGAWQPTAALKLAL
jgi:outer membrane protein OmpA-like peptidoglycan-associated protein